MNATDELAKLCHTLTKHKYLITAEEERKETTTGVVYAYYATARGNGLTAAIQAKGASPSGCASSLAKLVGESEEVKRRQLDTTAFLRRLRGQYSPTERDTMRDTLNAAQNQQSYTAMQKYFESCDRARATEHDQAA